MQRKLNYTAAAAEDLIALRRWLTQPGSGSAARRRLMNVRTAIDKLRSLPCLYGLSEHAGTRELACPGGYRVLYELSPDTGRNETAGDVLVLRIFGPGQDRSVL